MVTITITITILYLSLFAVEINSFSTLLSLAHANCPRSRGVARESYHQTSTRIRATSDGNTWRSAIICNPATGNKSEAWKASIKNLCTSTPCRSPGRGEQGLAFLFVSQRYQEEFEEIVMSAHQILGSDTTLLSIVGAGVIGGGMESDDPTVPAISLLCGVLPSSAGLEVFMFGPDEQPPPPSSEAWKAIGRAANLPSYVIFTDGFAPIQQILEGLDASGADGNGAIVAGGISCPAVGSDLATVAINSNVYPRGAAVGVGLSGTVGLQTVVAQGCRPVGPVFTVTDARENMVDELDGKPAIEILSDIRGGEYLTAEDKARVETSGILCGLAVPNEDTGTVSSGDYLIRQIFGFRVPGFMIGGEAREGDNLQFHVRDKGAAMEDLRTMVGKARTERSFAGAQRAGVPLAAVQVSCIARGRSLFGSRHFDLETVRELVRVQKNDETAIGGFFANGEIGPVGVAGVGLGSGKQTHVHGFTAVAATICDFRDRKSVV